MSLVSYDYLEKSLKIFFGSSIYSNGSLEIFIFRISHGTCWNRAGFQPKLSRRFSDIDPFHYINQWKSIIFKDLYRNCCMMQHHFRCEIIQGSSLQLIFQVLTFEKESKNPVRQPMFRMSQDVLDEITPIQSYRANKTMPITHPPAALGDRNRKKHETHRL